MRSLLLGIGAAQLFQLPLTAQRTAPAEVIYDPRVAGAPVAFDAFARPVELPPQPAAGGTALQWALFMAAPVAALAYYARTVSAARAAAPRMGSKWAPDGLLGLPGDLELAGNATLPATTVSCRDGYGVVVPTAGMRGTAAPTATAPKAQAAKLLGIGQEEAAPVADRSLYGSVVGSTVSAAKQYKSVKVLGIGQDEATTVTDRALYGSVIGPTVDQIKTVSAPSIVPTPVAPVAVPYSPAGLAPVTEEEVLEVQKNWAGAIQRISKVHKDKGDYIKAASDAAGELYAYGHDNVLFKPPKAAEYQFRPTPGEAMSYFVGGAAVETGYTEDAGFAINGGKGWASCVYDNHQIDLNGDVALAMGNYYFTCATTGDVAKVEYTFGYKRCEDGKVRICLHHSSVPYSA
jgi:hypothetical protein